MIFERGMSRWVKRWKRVTAGAGGALPGNVVAVLSVIGTIGAVGSVVAVAFVFLAIDVAFLFE